MKPYYQDDFVTLYNGDCLEVTKWLDADVLITDPPYGISYTPGRMSNYDNTNKSTIANDRSIDVRDNVLKLWSGKPSICFGSWRSPRPANTKQRLIWYKENAAPGFRTAPWYGAEEEIYVSGDGFIGKPEQNVLITKTLQYGANGLVAQIGHPTPKPVWLMERLISKCPENWLIADTFAGSGSTLLAARNLGRKSIGIEINEKYCELIANRLSQQSFIFEDAQ